LQAPGVCAIKHFITVIYNYKNNPEYLSNSDIAEIDILQTYYSKLFRFKTLPDSIHIATYFATVVIYNCKMRMKWTLGGQYFKTF
jgi:hypothetical protein